TPEDILTSNAIGTAGGNNANHDYRLEYNQNWSFAIQHLITPNTVLELSYQGSHTVGTDDATHLNVPIPGPGSIASRRPIPSLNVIPTIRWNGYGFYDALIFRAERRLASGLSFAASYTWSKAIDDASDIGATVAENNVPQNVYNLAGEKGLSSFD